MRFHSLGALVAVTLTGCPDQGVIVHNAEPTAEITSHSSDSHPYAGVETFHGVVDDPDNSIDELLVSWTYDGTEVCPALPPDDSGNSICDITLESGEHTVALRAEDPRGGLGVASLTMDITAHGDPWASIESPTESGVYYSNRLIEFSGAVGDDIDAPGQLSAWWKSSLDGELDVEALPDTSGRVNGSGNLSEGEHQVTLYVENTGGGTNFDNVIIEVGPPNTVPTCAITAPHPCPVRRICRLGR